jgi:hypothetical protein
MARVVLDLDEVNQHDVVTLNDGTVVTLSDDVDRRTLDRIAQQLHVFRSAYAHALADPILHDEVATGKKTVDEVSPLYLRVAQLQTLVRSSHRRPAHDLDPRVLLQTRTWVNSSGVARELVSLTPTHRRNMLGWLERNSDDLQTVFADADLTADERNAVKPASPWVAGTPLYRRVVELIDAETERERAMDRARQVVRSVEFERSGEWPDR